MADPDYRYCPHCRSELRPPSEAARRASHVRNVGSFSGAIPFRSWPPIVERADRVVLVHSIGRPPTWFGLVAGFLERGEHPEAAVLREVAEELGLDGRLADTIGIYPFERLNQVIFVTTSVVPDDVPITLAPDELDGYQEVPLEKLRPWRQGTGPGLRAAVARGYDPPLVDFGTPLEL